VNIISNTIIVLAGQTAQGIPFPQFLPDVNEQGSFLAVCNIGPCDCHVAVGTTAGVAADSSGTLVAAANYAGSPGQLRSLSAAAIGPFVTIPIAPGDLFFSALAVQTLIAAAYTNGTASSDSTTLTVDSTTGISEGQSVDGAGIPAGTVVSELVGATVTLSQPTTAALNETPLQFSAPPTVQPPGILAIAVGI
jgi:hypothetical protein